MAPRPRETPAPTVEDVITRFEKQVAKSPDDAEGWRKLTLRWGLFFFLLAGINELVWRTQTTDFWVSFKVFGTMPITIIFALAQIPLIMKHEIKDEDEPEHW